MKNSTARDILPHVRLQFHVKYPLLEDCYLDGYECATNDADESENPYKMCTLESDMWLDGWWAGFYEEQKLFLIDGADDSAEFNDFSPIAANDISFDPMSEHINSETTITKVAKVAAAVAATFLGYQVIDLIA